MDWIQELWLAMDLEDEAFNNLSRLSMAAVASATTRPPDLSLSAPGATFEAVDRQAKGLCAQLIEATSHQWAPLEGSLPQRV